MYSAKLRLPQVGRAAARGRSVGGLGGGLGMHAAHCMHWACGAGSPTAALRTADACHLVMAADPAPRPLTPACLPASPHATPLQRMPAEEKQRIVDEVISELGLESTRDTYIGTVGPAGPA